MFSRQPDAGLTQDQEDIQLTLELLRVSEFRLFELAYKEWFGDSATEGDLEGAYIPYLAKGTVPCWVRQYARNIRRLTSEAGVIQQCTRRPGCQPRSGVIQQGQFDLSITLMLLLLVLVALL